MKQERKRTPFGDFFYKTRKRNNQTIVDGANALNVSIAYISAVEHGDKEIPKGWRDKIIRAYGLNGEEIKALDSSIDATPSTKRVSLKDIEICLTSFVDNLSKNPDEREKMMNDLHQRLNELIK